MIVLLGLLVVIGIFGKNLSDQLANSFLVLTKVPDAGSLIRIPIDVGLDAGVVALSMPPTPPDDLAGRIDWLAVRAASGDAIARHELDAVKVRRMDGGREGPEIDAVLKVVLGRRPVAVRRAAAEAFLSGAIDRRAARQSAERFLLKGDARHRVAATHLLSALAVVGEATPEPGVLLERLHDGNSEVRAAVAEALGNFPSPEVVDRLLASIRTEAVDAPFRAALDAVVAITVADARLAPRAGIALADLLDTDLKHDRLRAVLETLTFMAGRELGPRATAWKEHWRQAR